MDKMYTLWLKYKTEDEQIEEHMVQWTKHVGYDILMKQWEKTML